MKFHVYMRFTKEVDFGEVEATTRQEAINICSSGNKEPINETFLTESYKYVATESDSVCTKDTINTT